MIWFVIMTACQLGVAEVDGMLQPTVDCGQVAIQTPAKDGDQCVQYGYALARQVEEDDILARIDDCVVMGDA